MDLSVHSKPRREYFTTYASNKTVNEMASKSWVEGFRTCERRRGFLYALFCRLENSSNVKTPSLQKATAMLHPENDTHLRMAASKISSAIFSLCDHLLTVEG